MGYTTSFVGQFLLSKKMNDLEIADTLNAWHDGEKVNGRNPIDGYCQWVLTKDRLHLEWDGGEKFYNYSDWLTEIIKLLLPLQIHLSGKVQYQGEEVGDSGILEIKKDIVSISPLKEEVKVVYVYIDYSVWTKKEGCKVFTMEEDALKYAKTQNIKDFIIFEREVL